MHLNLGNFDSSLVYQERALAIERVALAPDDEALGNTAYNLGAAYVNRQDFEAAHPFFEEAHRIYDARLGANHKRTIGALAGIAMTMHFTGDVSGARGLQRRVVSLQEQALGAAHPDLGTSILHLASLERELGDLNEARGLAVRALGICEDSFGPSHPQVAAVLGILAEIERDADETAEALALARRGLGIFEGAGLENLGTLEALERVGDIERAMGNEREAVALFERGSALASKLFGDDHDVTVRLRAKLAP